MCLGNVSKDFTANNMKKKNRIKYIGLRSFVDYNTIGTSNIVDIHKYFKSIKKFEFIKKLFIGLSNVFTLVSFSRSFPHNYEEPIKFVTLNNRLC